MRLPRLSGPERALIAIFLLTLPLLRPRLRGEGNGHYAWLASVVIDGDLDVENQYRRGDPDFVASTFRRADGQLWPTMETSTGRARNQFSVGPALLWAPAFLQAHALATLASALGAPLAADGYSPVYLWACALATAGLGFAGLLLACRVSAAVVAPMPAVLATLGVWLASSLPVYLYALPFYAHVPAAFMVALFLWFWRRALAPGGPLRWGVWGALTGLMVQVDPLSASFLVVALVEWLRGARHARSPAASLASGAAFATAGLLSLLPQGIAYAVAHGSPFDSGRFHRFFWDEPQLLAHAFGSENGVFLWTPLTLLALAGLLGLAGWHDRVVGGSLLAAVAIFLYCVASVDLWVSAPGFGNRFLVPLSPVWVVGLAATLRATHAGLRRWFPGERMRWAGLAVGLALAAAWNLGLVFQWGTGMVPRREAVDFRQVARQQLSEVPGRLADLVRQRRWRSPPQAEPAASAGDERP